MILAVVLLLTSPQEVPDIVQYRGTYANRETNLCFSVPDDWVAEDVPGTTDTRVGGPLYGPNRTLQANVILRVKRTSRPVILRSLAADMLSYVQELWHPSSVPVPTFSKNKEGAPTAQILHDHTSPESGEAIRTVYSLTVTSPQVYVYAYATATVRAWPEYGLALTQVLSTISACPSTKQ